jgi:hypothetical protein
MKRREQYKQVVQKVPPAGVHVAMVDGNQAAPGQAQKKCKFTEVVGFTGSYPPWLCKAFGDKVQEERSKIITENKMCPFCLLHNADEVCFSRANKSKPICEEPGCKGQHVKWLNEMLKEIPWESAKREGKVNVVQGEGGWRTPEDTWMEMEEVEEEVFFVNTLQKEGPDSDEELEAEIARTGRTIDDCF